jgi:hypothetical protein
MNCIVKLYCGPCRGSLLYGRLRMHTMSSLSLSLLWHLLDWVLQLQGSGHCVLTVNVRSCSCVIG